MVGADAERLFVFMTLKSPLLEAIPDAIPDAVLIVRSDGTIQYANASAVELFGYSNAEFIGMTIEALMPEGSRTRHVTLRTDYVAAPSPRTMGLGRSLCALRKDGTRFPVEIALGVLGGDSIAVVRDLTKKQAADEKSRENALLLDAFFQNTHTAMAILDSSLRYVQVNTTYALTGHRPAGSYVGLRHCGIFADPEDEAILRRVLETGELYEESARPFRHPEGGESSWDISLVPIPSTGGGPQMLVLSLKDVTERERALRELRETQEKLRQVEKVEAIGRFAGMLVHDFNNILTAIVGFGAVLRDEVRPSLREDADAIVKSGERAARLTRKLLSFSRGQILSPQVLKLSQLLEENRGLLARILGDDIELQLALDAATPAVFVDGDQLVQVLLNLTVNARDAMPDGGVLRIAASRCLMNDGCSDERVELLVADTGTGMDEVTQAHIFEPFFTTKKPGMGTGMGLASVYGIVAQNSGEIRVRSELGVGTTFTICFPVAAEQSGAAPHAQADKAPRPRSPGALSGRVLVVDDEPAILRVLSQILSAVGLQVTEAGNGQVAAEILRTRQDFDLLLTDLIMPGMGGRLLATHFLTRCPGASVIYMSGFTRDFEVAQMSEADEEIPFVLKPFDRDELLVAVSAAIASARA